MSNSQSRRLRKQLTCLALSSATALSVTVSQPASAQIPWFNLIFRGVQLIKLSNVSDRQEVQIGQQINRQLISRGMPLSKDAQLNNYVNRIGQRLAAASTRNDIPYKFQVVKDSRINAFATMGGYVYVTTGLLAAADNEAQLASVMAHEIGHIASRHLVEQMRQQALTQGVASAAGLDRNVAASIALDLAVNRPNSRKDEFEADQAGLKIMRQASYAESAAPTFMRKLLKQRSTPTFLSTHPAVPDRIEALEKSIRTGPGNSCRQSPATTACGLNNTTYQQSVKSRLG